METWSSDMLDSACHMLILFPALFQVIEQWKQTWRQMINLQHITWSLDFSRQMKCQLH